MRSVRETHLPSLARTASHKKLENDLESYFAIANLEQTLNASIMRERTKVNYGFKDVVFLES